MVVLLVSILILFSLKSVCRHTFLLRECLIFLFFIGGTSGYMGDLAVALGRPERVASEDSIQSGEDLLTV